MITTTTGGPTYAKIIGNNFGSYPYRIGLNTLKHNGETFAARPERGPGGLYYYELKDILKSLAYGDQLCIVRPVGQVVTIKSTVFSVTPGNPIEYGYKTDRLEIISMMDLCEIDTWKFLVIDNGINIHGRDYNALRWASSKGHLKIVKFLVEHGADVHADEDAPLRFSARTGHIEVVKFLVEHGADVHANKDTALRLAAEFNHLEVVKFFVERGANVHAYDGAVLRLPVVNGHLEVVKFLVENGADVHANNNRVLRLAAENGRPKIVEYLTSLKKE